MNIQRIVGLAAFLLLALNMFVCETEAYTKAQWTFIPGSRYGRGGRVNAKKIFAPRNERFELGTRYGKRSSIGEIPETLIYPSAPLTAGAKTMFCGKDDELMCLHTGVADIYRCNQSFEADAMDAPPQGAQKD